MEPEPLQTALFPYSDHLEHLEDRLRRAAQLVAAFTVRYAARRGLGFGAAEHDAADQIAALSRMVSNPPEGTVALWKQADETLDLIRAREAITKDVDLPFLRIARTFNLSQVEQDILALVAAPRIDPRLAEQWSENVDIELDNPEVGGLISLLARTFDDSVSMRRLFSMEGQLIKNSLLVIENPRAHNLLRIRFILPQRIVDELLGDAHVAPELMSFMKLRRPKVSLDQVVLPSETKDLVLSLVRDHSRYLERRKAWGIDDVITYGRGLVLLFAGPPGTGKTMLAHAVANATNKSLFTVDAAKLADRSMDLERSIDAVFREANLFDAALFFDECEQLFADRRYGDSGMATLLTRLEHFEGVAILATNMEQFLDEALSRRILARIDFRAPTREERLEIWRKHIPPQMPLDADVDIEKLAENWELTGGTIKNAALAGTSRAISRGAESVNQSDLEHGARLQIRFDGDDSRRIVEPEAKLDDVILPSEIRGRLDRFIGSARARTTALIEWGFGRTVGHGTGLCALLSGPSGTGKSMTAEAIATALGRPLLRCQLPFVVSKYVGDTAKNIEQLFRLAKEHRAVLVFDEADALFAKRVEVRSANDRFVNAETGALLTQLERHEGVVVLTTNHVTDLDPAFERRLHLRLEFPLPDAYARAAIWRRLLPADAPITKDVDVMALAKLFELSGGLIRNAVLTAALEAASAKASERRITHAMLERAAEEQLGRDVASSIDHLSPIGSA